MLGRAISVTHAHKALIVWTTRLSFRGTTSDGQCSDVIALPLPVAHAHSRVRRSTRMRRLFGVWIAGESEEWREEIRLVADRTRRLRHWQLLWYGMVTDAGRRTNSRQISLDWRRLLTQMYIFNMIRVIEEAIPRNSSKDELDLTLKKLCLKIYGNWQVE